MQKTICPRVSPHHRQGCGLTCKPCCPRGKEHSKGLCWRWFCCPLEADGIQKGWGRSRVLSPPALFPISPGCAAPTITFFPSHLQEGCPPGKAPFPRIQELFHHPVSQSSSSLGKNLFHVSILRKPEHHQRRSGRIPKSVTHPLSNVSSVIQSVLGAHWQLRGCCHDSTKCCPPPGRAIQGGGARWCLCCPQTAGARGCAMFT